MDAVQLLPWQASSKLCHCALITKDQAARNQCVFALHSIMGIASKLLAVALLLDMFGRPSWRFPRLRA